MNNNIEIMKFFLDNGADVNKQNKNGNSPLHAASFKNNLEAVKLLIRYGADILSGNEDGITPLHAAAFGNAVKTTEYILEYANEIFFAEMISENKKVDITDNNGRTPLHISAVANSKETAEFLIDNNADVNKKTKNGKTPYMLSFGNFRFRTAKIIKKNGGKWS